LGQRAFHCGALYRIQAYTLGSKQVRRFSGSRTKPKRDFSILLKTKYFNRSSFY
jgi:hypothetical protein